MTRGDRVTLSSSEGTVTGTILIATANQLSLAVTFEGMFMGYLFWMPLLMQNGHYTDLMQGRAVAVKPLRPN
jgi:hypothetical protein